MSSQGRNGGGASDGRVTDRLLIAVDGVGQDFKRGRSAISVSRQERREYNGDGTGSAGVIVAAVDLGWIARIGSAGAQFDDALRLRFVEDEFHKLSVQRTDAKLEVSHEHSLVAQEVFDGTPVLIAAEVVHDELPATAEVAGAVRHLRIDRGSVGDERFHAILVPDVTGPELRVGEIGIFIASQTGSATCPAHDAVLVGQDQLIPEPIRSR